MKYCYLLLNLLSKCCEEKQGEFLIENLSIDDLTIQSYEAIPCFTIELCKIISDYALQEIDTVNNNNVKNPLITRHYNDVHLKYNESYRNPARNILFDKGIMFHR